MITSRRAALRAACASARMFAECRREVISAETDDPAAIAGRLREVSARPPAIIGSTLGTGIPHRWRSVYSRAVVRYYRAETARIARLVAPKGSP